MDSFLELYSKQFISKLAKPNGGALREDLSENVSILQAFKLCERDWVLKEFEIFYTTKIGEGLALKALEERIEKEDIFEKLIEINLYGSFLILKYLEFMINHLSLSFQKSLSLDFFQKQRRS